MNDKPSRMDYRQHQAARRLVHECCNYDEGNCLLLDDGEPCVCVQSISYSLMCRWFRVAVLPLDGELAAALLYRGSRKRCAVCGAAFVPKSNRGKYCPGCACVGNHVPSHGNHHVIESLAVLGLQSVSDLCRAGDHEPNVIERNHAMRPRVGGVLTP